MWGNDTDLIHALVHHIEKLQEKHEYLVNSLGLNKPIFHSKIRKG
jgi:hypothetical protein